MSADVIYLKPDRDSRCVAAVTIAATDAAPTEQIATVYLRLVYSLAAWDGNITSGRPHAAGDLLRRRGVHEARIGGI